jgi:hypothetical protein
MCLAWSGSRAGALLADSVDDQTTPAGGDVRNENKRKRAPAPPPLEIQRSAPAVIPWTNILGDGERPMAERSHRDGQGLVVILGPVDRLVLDLPSPRDLR